MKRYYTIIQISDKTRRPIDTIKYIASLYGACTDELLNEMGYDNAFDMYQQSPSHVVLARKLNDILKSIYSNIRIGGGENAISIKGSIF